MADAAAHDAMSHSSAAADASNPSAGQAVPATPQSAMSAPSHASAVGASSPGGIESAKPSTALATSSAVAEVNDTTQTSLQEERAALDRSNVAATASGTQQHVWPCKRVLFPPGSSDPEGEVSIVLQNENGPCSLIALANLLLLRRQIALRPSTKHVSYEELAERIADHLLTRLGTATGLESQLGLSEALEVLPKCRYGLDVNVRFASADGFADDGTGALALFRLAGVKLLHGWVVDEGDPGYEAVVTRAGDYDTAVARVVEADELESRPVDQHTDAQRQVVSDALQIRQFLLTSASQLTYPGLFALASSHLQPGELAAFFRNSHFVVVYRRPSRAGEPTLFHLCTDATLSRAKEVVWEGLTDVDGSSAEFYDAHLVPASFKDDFVPPPSPARERRAGPPPVTRMEEGDAMLAAQMQQQEHDEEQAYQQRRAEERERERRSQVPQPRPIPVPAAQAPTTQSKRKPAKGEKCVVS